MLSPDEMMTGLIREFVGGVCWQTRAKIVVIPHPADPAVGTWITNFDRIEAGQIVSIENHFAGSIDVEVGDAFVSVFGLKTVSGIPAESAVTLRVQDGVEEHADINFSVNRIGDGDGPVVGTKKPPGDSGTG